MWTVIQIGNEKVSAGTRMSRDKEVEHKKYSISQDHLSTVISRRVSAAFPEVLNHRDHMADSAMPTVRK